MLMLTSLLDACYQSTHSPTYNQQLATNALPAVLTSSSPQTRQREVTRVVVVLVRGRQFLLCNESVHRNTSMSDIRLLIAIYEWLTRKPFLSNRKRRGPSHGIPICHIASELLPRIDYRTQFSFHVRAYYVIDTSISESIK